MRAPTPKERLLAPRVLVGAGLILAASTVVFWQVWARLFDAWTNDGNYSHGWLIIPLSLWFAWERRDKLFATAPKPSWFGLVVIVGSLGVLLAGLLGAELFLSRIAIVGTTVGIVLFLFGWAHLRILTFPLAFLLLMIPIPAIIFNQIAFPLQLFASEFGQFCMTTAKIPVLREGNVLILAHTTLEVAEACSGIRSLISLVTLALVFGYFTDPRMWVRTAIVLSAVPVAIIANGMRVAGTGMAAQWYGPEAAQGFFHDFSGWAVFAVAFVMMLLVHRVIVWFAPAPKEPEPPALPEPAEA